MTRTVGGGPASPGVRVGLVVGLTVLVVGLTGAGPRPAAARAGAVAAAAPGRPERLVVVAATRTSLTLQWPRIRGARWYGVRGGTGLAMAHRRGVASPSRSSVTVHGLRPGRLYCFRVRAVDAGNARGEASPKACQHAVGRQGPGQGLPMRVVTYNACAEVCGHWDRRRPAAARLVRRQHPAVVALQETPPDSGLARAIGGMRRVVAYRGKVLLVRTDRFRVASPARGRPRKGVLDLGRDPVADAHRYAVWAELVARGPGRRHHGHRPGGRHHRHVLVVSVHLSPRGDTRRDDAIRAANTRRLLAGLRRINPRHLPMVVAGDFNSNQGRTYDSPGRLLRGSGLRSAFFRAHHWRRPDHNSATLGKTLAVTGVPWGYHVDQVWVQPRRTRVRTWVNAAPVHHGRYPTPQISDHCPIRVDLLLS